MEERLIEKTGERDLLEKNEKKRQKGEDEAKKARRESKNWEGG